MKKQKSTPLIKHNTKRYHFNIQWILPIFVILLIFSYWGINFIKNLTYQNVYNNISELSEQTTTQLNLSISEQMKFVEIMVDSINSGYFKTVDSIFERYEHDLEDYHFTRLVVLDKQGNGTTSDGHIVENYANIEEFFNQDTVYLSENRPSTVSNNQVNIYSKTFRFQNQDLVLFATVNTEDYKEILLRRLFHGEGGTYLINNSGAILIDSFGEVNQNNVNLYDFLKTKYDLTSSNEIDKLNEMFQNIINRKVGTFDIHFNKTTYFIHYEKLNVNDWYVVSIAPDDTIAKELTTFITISLITCLFITFIVITICVYIDFSNQEKSRKLYHIAYIDPVTSLGNQLYFQENGTRFLQNHDTNCYILSLDINKFKALNNIYGYEFCNKILNSLAQKLTAILPPKHITCRISNDVFASLFYYDGSIETLLDRIFQDTSSFHIDGTSLHINLSIGVYKIKSTKKDINKLLAKAYMARAKIKGLYHNNYYIFDEILEKQLMEEQEIESSMEDALKNEEFVVVYQPKTLTSSEKLIGAEALVRWHKNGTVIPPNKFIPLFEKNKFIMKLDLYIFEKVCQDIATWKEKYNYSPIISINVSKEHFVNENFIDTYVDICNKYHIDRKLIDLEITESATIDEKIDILKVLNVIKEKGFTISIDDFGTGYSSLSMLQNMPIDIIKIDKVFVDKADLNSQKNIINYIMILANRLGVKTIVEGVETKEQVDFVKNLKCDMIQGYYYSKPIDKSEFEDYFNKNK